MKFVKAKQRPEGDQKQNFKIFSHFWVPWESFIA